MTQVGVFAAIFDDEHRILCIKRNTGARSWSMPGGRLFSNESPPDALVRSVRQETGFNVRVTVLIGAYSRPQDDELALTFHVEIVSRELWFPDDSIAEIRFFAVDELPQPMLSHTRRRVEDAFEERCGVIVVHTP